MSYLREVLGISQGQELGDYDTDDLEDTFEREDDLDSLTPKVKESLSTILTCGTSFI